MLEPAGKSQSTRPEVALQRLSSTKEVIATLR